MAIALEYQQVYLRRRRKVLVPIRYQIAAAVLLFFALATKVWVKIECTENGYALAKLRQEAVALDIERRELELHVSVLLKPDNLVMRGKKKLGLTVLNPKQATKIVLYDRAIKSSRKDCSSRMKKRRYRQTSFDFASRRTPSVSNVLPGKSRKARMGFLFVVSLVWAGIVTGRLFSLQISDFETWHDWALKQHVTKIELASERGPITDRDGKLLAVSVPAGSVYVRPGQIKDKDTAAKQIADVLNIDRKDVASKLAEKKPFVWVARQIPRQQAEKVTALNIKGAGFLLEPRRYYPYKEAASTLIGKVGVDGKGLSGVELVQEKSLHEQNRKTSATRDALGNLIQVPGDDEKFEIPKGSELRLTLDTAIQQIVDEELQVGQKNANSKAAMAVMIDASTGEILAMSQSPSPNFNLAKGSSSEMKNLLVEAVFEPGSIFKPLITAAALEEKVVRPSDMINCEHGRFQFASHTIKDVHPSDTITVRDVVVRSSNIGMTKIGIKLGKDKLYNYIRRFGFGERSKLSLPGESEGILRPVSTWALVDVATHSFGQGVAVTPLQIVRAMSAIANGGKLPTLRIVDDGSTFELKRVLSEETASKVKEMMYGVVEDEHGTGGKAEIDGVRIGGKTGTAQKAKPNGRGYMPGTYVSSFVGFADASPIGLNRTLTLAVIVDEPHANSIYGGTLAAPVFKRIMQRTLHLLTTRSEIGGKDAEIRLPGEDEENERGDVIIPEKSSSKGFTPVNF